MTPFCSRTQPRGVGVNGMDEGPVLSASHGKYYNGCCMPKETNPCSRICSKARSPESLDAACETHPCPPLYFVRKCAVLLLEVSRLLSDDGDKPDVRNDVRPNAPPLVSPRLDGAILQNLVDVDGPAAMLTSLLQ
eukprot:6293119-Amphidinium_carterae.1